MRAFVLTRYGGPEVSAMRDEPEPEPGPGEVLIRVHAAGLNPVDYKIRDGQLKLLQSFTMPVVMGYELAGVVERAGPGTTRFKPGDWVFSRLPTERMGALAEYAVAPEDVLAPIPPRLDFIQSAAIPLAGLTALQVLRDELKLKKGDKVFISGGAGGVGTFAIQIAKWLGAHVTTTASPRGRDLVERMGADEVIDYTTQDFAQHVREMDGAFDLIGGETLNKTFGVVKPGGTVVSISAIPEPQTAFKDLNRGYGMAALFWLASFGLRARARKHGVHYRFVLMHPSGAELEELGDLAESGLLEPVIDRVFDFEETAAAMAYLEQGRAKGKVVVKMRD